MAFLARRVIFLARNTWATKLLFAVHEMNYSYDLRKKQLISLMVKLMGRRKNIDKKSWLNRDLILSDFKTKGCLQLG